MEWRVGNCRLEIAAEQLCNLDLKFLVAVNIMYVIPTGYL